MGKKHSGKTCAAASFPAPLRFEDFDGRIQGIQGAAWLREKVERGDIDFNSYRPKGLGTGKGIYDAWVENLNTLSTMARDVATFPKTEVVDSITAQALGFLLDAIPSTHEGSKGKRIGTMLMPGPEDFGAESNGVQGSLSHLRSLPFQNLIVTTHLMPMWAKQDPSNPMSPQVEVGEKLALRDKLAANIGIFFDHIFRFERRIVGGIPRFFVRFHSDLACTSYQLPVGEFDITGKNFYDFLMEKVAEGTKSNGS